MGNPLPDFSGMSKFAWQSMQNVFIEYATFRHGLGSKLQSRKKVKARTISGEISAINTALIRHGVHGGHRLLMDELRRVIAGIKKANKFFFKQDGSKARMPILDPIANEMIRHCRTTQEVSIIALAQQGMLRCSEYAKTPDTDHYIRMGYIRWYPNYANAKRLDIILPHRKNDQIGNFMCEMYFKCTCKTTKHCVFHVIKKLLKGREFDDKDSPLFLDSDKRSPLPGRKVLALIKRLCIAIGVDPAGYAPHCLRYGGATQAKYDGMSYEEIQDRGAWRVIDSVRSYIKSSLKDVALFVDDPVEWKEQCKQRKAIYCDYI